MFVLKLSCSANVKVIILMSWEQFLQMLLAAWFLSRATICDYLKRNTQHMALHDSQAG